VLPGATRTWCPYEGAASHWSMRVGQRTLPDPVWAHEDPLPDAVQPRGLLCAFDQRLDVTVDGVRRERPITPWS
jgi:uncharacterized protein (DUF427 family)